MSMMGVDPPRRGGPRDILDPIKRTPAMRKAYMNNPTFHAFIDQACQARNEREAFKILLEGMTQLVGERDYHYNEHKRMVERHGD